MEVIPAIAFDAVTVHAVKTIVPFAPLLRAALTPPVKTDPFALTTPAPVLWIAARLPIAEIVELLNARFPPPAFPTTAFPVLTCDSVQELNVDVALAVAECATQIALLAPAVNVELLKTKFPVEVFKKQLPPFTITQSPAFIVKVADPELRTTFCVTAADRLRKTELLIVKEPEPEHVIAGVFVIGPAMTCADSSVNPAAPVTVKHPEVPARRSHVML